MTDNQIRVKDAFDKIAAAHTVTILSLDEMESIVNRALSGEFDDQILNLQHTICAKCGIDKPTPLRRDEMGGYVCLTCIDRELNRLEQLEAKYEPDLSQYQLGKPVIVNHERYKGPGILKHIQKCVGPIAFVELGHGYDRPYELETVKMKEEANAVSDL